MTSSHTVQDAGRTRRNAALATGTELYIDWGPDLPARYVGGRAHLMVANPTTLFVAWESELAAPERWALVVTLDGYPTQRADVPGKSPDVWLQVPAGSSGAVHLTRVEGDAQVEVAVLPFRTPPAAPAPDGPERWGRLDATGHVTAAPAPEGGRAPVEDGLPFEGPRVGYESADSGGSSSPYRGG